MSIGGVKIIYLAPFQRSPGFGMSTLSFGLHTPNPTGVDDVVNGAIAIITSERSYGDPRYERKSSHLAVEGESNFGEEHI